MFQDIAPDEYNNDFAFVQAMPEDKLIVYRGKSVLAYVDGESFRAPTFADFGLDPQTLREEGRAGAPKVLLAHADPVVRAGDEGVTDPDPGLVGEVGSAPEAHAADDTTSPCEAGSATASAEHQVLVAHDDPLAQGAVATGARSLASYIYLFRVGEDRYFMADLPARAIDHLAEQPGWEFLPLVQLVDHGPKPVRFALMVGYEYWTWYESAQYCGRCGAKAEHDGRERMMRCPECGLMTFPKVFPAVIIGITRPDSKVLATRYAGRPYSNYALVAGFCEMGETVEQTVHREVMEEVGLRVKNLRYYKSQPWPDSSSLLFGFFCELDGPADITLDENELSYAEWVDREQLLTDNDHSLTRDMMGVLRDRRETDYCIVQP